MLCSVCFFFLFFLFFFQAEDGIRDLVRSRGLGDVYKRQITALRNSTVIDELIEGPNTPTPGTGKVPDR